MPTAGAMSCLRTMHKSQCSEFDNVLLISPDKESAVLTRERLYAGTIG
jgi:ATP-dependent exoDNAse (exonuclease V) alpha subunit